MSLRFGQRVITILLSVYVLTGISVFAEKPRVLVVTGGHKYEKTSFNKMFESFSGLNCVVKEVDKNKGGAPFADVESFAYDTIVLYNFRNNMPPQTRKPFMKLLDRGVGLVVLHHAIAAYPGWLEFEKTIGATYVLKEQDRDGIHYPRPVWKHGVDMKIHVEDPAHPITQGVEDFTIHDETYKKWVYHEDNHLLLTTDHALSNKQIAWTRPHPKARVVYIQLGHDQHAFQNENFRKILRQSIQWAVKK